MNLSLSLFPHGWRLVYAAGLILGALLTYKLVQELRAKR